LTQSYLFQGLNASVRFFFPVITSFAGQGGVSSSFVVLRNGLRLNSGTNAPMKRHC